MLDKTAVKPLLLAGLLAMTSCSPAALAGIAGGLQAMGNTSTLPSGGSSGPLYIFGGADHKTFLGCLTCAETSSNSVFNEYSQFGNSFGSNSLYNSFGNFGSKFGNYSACNGYASDPPVVVTAQGEFVGRLTLNTYARGAITDERVIQWLNRLCGG